MTLGEAVGSGQVIGCFCASCGAKTILQPGFFLARRGDIAIQDLVGEIVCGGCGATSVKLSTGELEELMSGRTDPE